LREEVTVNKIDIAKAVNADADKMVRDARIINPRIDVLKMSLKTGEGFDEWVDFVKKSICGGILQNSEKNSQTAGL